LKVLFDTNVLFAAFATEGLCVKLLTRVNLGDFQLYTCPYILKELQQNLKRKLSLSKVEMEEIFSLIEEISESVTPEKFGIEVAKVCRDKDDDNIIAGAKAAGVDYIVTGDNDLLVLDVYEGIEIINPRAFEILLNKINEQ